MAPITFRYETTNGYTDLTPNVSMCLCRRTTRVVSSFPAYYSPRQRSWVEVMEGDAVHRVGSAHRGHESSPMWLDLTLPPDSAPDEALSAGAPPGSGRAHPIEYVSTWPRTLDPAPLALSGMAPPSRHCELRSSLHPMRGAIGDPGNRVDDVVSGAATRSARCWKKGASFVVRGTLYRGGFTVGLLKNDLWTTSVNVVVPGEFLAVVEAPEDGRYIPALAT